MTHTNHRSGTTESLRNDYVFIIAPAKGINDSDARSKLESYLRLAEKYSPVNSDPMKCGDNIIVPPGIHHEIGRPPMIAQITFDAPDKMQSFIRDIAAANPGLSVVVSGLFDEIEGACHRAGIKPHTAQCSLGIWGRLEKLPEPEVLDIATMCGHGLIPFSLIKRLGLEVKLGKTKLTDAVDTLTRPCVCGVFNPTRAEALLKRYIAKI